MVQAVYQQEASSSLKTTINLIISGRKLKDLDVLSKSDPVCILYEKSSNGQWVEVGKTEQINNNLNPDFTRAFEMSYYFEKSQEIRFLMIDGDGDGSYDTIGSVETTIGKVMGSKQQTFTDTLYHNGKSGGTIIVKAEAVQESKQAVSFNYSWANIRNQIPSCLGLCNEPTRVRLEVQREVAGQGRYVRVTTSPLRFGNTFNIPKETYSMAQICNSNPDVKIRFAVIAENDMELHAATVDIGKLGTQDTITLQADRGAVCTLKNCKIFDRPTFVDYLQSGWSISMVTAIDYTASNSATPYRGSLHALDGNNQYIQALGMVGSIVEPYDADRNFPTFGFGGVPNHMNGGAGGVSHCFPINGNPVNPEIFGV